MDWEATTDPPQAAAAAAADPDPEAFAALADERRLAVLEELLAAERDGRTPTFSDLCAAVDADTSAGFAYHLRQLAGRYVEETDRGYALTGAGRAVARAAAREPSAGWFDGLALEDDCPFCGAAALATERRDRRVAVACGDCDRRVLDLPLPPRGGAGDGAGPSRAS